MSESPESKPISKPSSEKSQTIGFLRNTGLGPLEINVGPFIGPPTRWPGFSGIKKKKTFSDRAQVPFIITNVHTVYLALLMV